MDRTTIFALAVGGLAFAAGVFRLVQRFIHFAWHGNDAEPEQQATIVGPQGFPL
jgi:hypothetical protein